MLMLPGVIKLSWHISALLFVFSGFQLACAQVNLKGKVSDNTGLPLQMAGVYPLPAGKPAFADSLGFFFLIVPEGTQKLLIQADGFERDTVFINDRRFFEIRLRALERTGKEIIVSGERNPGQLDYKSAGLQLNIDRQEMRKAACCNLSESFETSPLVDVSYPDPVTGIRQIQMLGLSGQYTGYSVENQTVNPGILGGMYASLIPGPWLESVQVQKGIAPVTSGTGMLAGQINSTFLKADSNSRPLANVFASDMGRLEGNMVIPLRKNEFGGTMLFLHGNTAIADMDMNSDGYRDFPVGKQVNAMVRSAHAVKKSFLQLNAHVYQDERIGGDNQFDGGNPQDFPGFGYVGRSTGVEVSGKAGKVFSGDGYRSIGIPWSAGWRVNEQIPGKNRIQTDEKFVNISPLYQADLGKNGSGFKAGVSLALSERLEKLEQRRWTTSFQFYIPEIRTGCFAEGSFVLRPGLLLVAGSRWEKHNLYGWWHSPRVHLRYESTGGLILRLAAGQAWQEPYVLVQNLAFFSSGRKLIMDVSEEGLPYGLKPEKGRSAELSATYNYRILPGKGSLLLDVFASGITNQVVADTEKEGELYIYNASGDGFSRGMACQFDQKIGRMFSFRLAYRYAATWLQYRQGLLSRPLFAFHRGFLHVDVQAGAGFSLNAGLQVSGRKRIYGTGRMSPPVPQVNLQLSKVWRKKIELSAGTENLTGFRQKELVLFPARPLSPEFDAANIWGPAIGRMFYLNFRAWF